MDMGILRWASHAAERERERGGEGEGEGEGDGERERPSYDMYSTS